MRHTLYSVASPAAPQAAGFRERVRVTTSLEANAPAVESSTELAELLATGQQTPPAGNARHARAARALELAGARRPSPRGRSAAHVRHRRSTRDRAAQRHGRGRPRRARRCRGASSRPRDRRSTLVELTPRAASAGPTGRGTPRECGTCLRPAHGRAAPRTGNGPARDLRHGWRRSMSLPGGFKSGGFKSMRSKHRDETKLNAELSPGIGKRVAQVRSAVQVEAADLRDPDRDRRRRRRPQPADLRGDHRQGHPS